MLEHQASGGRGYDWTVVLLSLWFVGGLFLDGWAHNHIPELESFFTPWHAVFYTGFLAVAGFLSATLVRNRAKGYPWQHAMPPGYELAILGVLTFMAGGIGDMIWHEIFGIESNVEALLSPTHLLIASGMTLIISGPFRAGWRRLIDQNDPAPGWIALLPQLLSITFLWSVMSFLTQFAHPLVGTWAAAGYRPPGSRGLALLRTSLGIASFLLQTGVMMGVVLCTVRRWTLPLGSLSLVFGLNAAFMSFMHDQYRLIPGAALTGLGADLLVRCLKPSTERSGALRLFALAVPIVYYSLYYLALIVTSGLEWSVHIWTGSIVLSGIVGLLLSYVLMPPLIRPLQASSSQASPAVEGLSHAEMRGRS
jgi:hypothetical protein